MKQNNLPFIDKEAIVQDVLVKMTEVVLALLWSVIRRDCLVLSLMEILEEH